MESLWACSVRCGKACVWRHVDDGQVCGEVYRGRLALAKLLHSSDLVCDSTAPEKEAETATLARLSNLVTAHA